MYHLFFTGLSRRSIFYSSRLSQHTICYLSKLSWRIRFNNLSFIIEMIFSFFKTYFYISSAYFLATSGLIFTPKLHWYYSYRGIILIIIWFITSICFEANIKFSFHFHKWIPSKNEQKQVIRLKWDIYGPYSIFYFLLLVNSNLFHEIN